MRCSRRHHRRLYLGGFRWCATCGRETRTMHWAELTFLWAVVIGLLVISVVQCVRPTEAAFMFTRSAAELDCLARATDSRNCFEVTR